MLIPIEIVLFSTLFVARSTGVKIVTFLPLLFLCGISFKEILAFKRTNAASGRAMNVYSSLAVVIYAILFFVLFFWTNQILFPSFAATVVGFVIADVFLMSGYFVRHMQTSWIALKEYFGFSRFLHNHKRNGIKTVSILSMERMVWGS